MRATTTVGTAPFVLLLLALWLWCLLNIDVPNLPEPWGTIAFIIIALAAVLAAIWGIAQFGGAILSQWRNWRPFIIAVFPGGYPPLGNYAKARTPRFRQRFRLGPQRFLLRVEPKAGQGAMLDRINVRFRNWPWLWWRDRPKVRRISLHVPNWKPSVETETWADTQAGYHLRVIGGHAWVEQDPIHLEVLAYTKRKWSGRVSFRAHLDNDKRRYGRKWIAFRP